MTEAEAEHDIYVTSNEFSQMTTDFEALHDMLQTLLADLQVPMTPGHAWQPKKMNGDDSDVNSRAAKLPRLELPTFPGYYGDWKNLLTCLRR